MAANAKNRQTDWTGRLEQLEDRLLMSADPVGSFLRVPLAAHAAGAEPPALEHHLQQTPDFWIDPVDESTLAGHLRGIDTALAHAHNQTGLSAVRANYGFLGRGQTVAVIDSGIAYDHFALGGGFGSNYRVVGGWDFTGENDNDPYDDGTAGAHGTHVSGILGADGADGSLNTGVAPEVDLVGLRVFDDSGAGFFSWVENALDWVHTNRNSFDNPITTVNLSLGVSNWNADTIPNWAMLEDEFARLEADGIFIAVSAGNSFTDYNTTGLSYPAASQHVVPVMSVNDNGLVSYFSQRSTRAIAAPGRGIVSTVPDYAGNNNGSTDDYASFSGTSMASPYVAGASVILREAMEFVGMTGITQDAIYDHMIATADTFTDSATGEMFNRLNLQAAFDALMPADEYGSTVATAYNLGSIGGGVNFLDTITTSGLLGTLGDADYFSFTAAATGTVSFTATSTQSVAPSWNANWDAVGGSGAISGASGETYTFEVVAGQAYTLGLSSPDGLGYYDLAIESESTFTETDWGVVTQSELAGVSNSGETWYRIEASQTGFLTAEAFFDAAAGDIGLTMYDTNLEQVASGVGSSGWDRVDAYAAAGSEYYILVTGTSADIDFRLTNLVSSLGSTVKVDGTAGDDNFSFEAGVKGDTGSRHVVTVNGVMYEFDAAYTSQINFDGGAGSDTITFTGTAGDETAMLCVDHTTLVSAGFSAIALGIENVTMYGNGGNDRADLYDSDGDDLFTAIPNSASLVGPGYNHIVVDFDSNYAFASTGDDRASLYDSAGNDLFYGLPEYALMRGENSEFYNYARGFDRVYAYAGAGGDDRASLYDSAGNDLFYGLPEYALMRGENSEFYNYARGFDRVYAYAGAGGDDRASLYDSAGNDLFYGLPEYALMRGENSEFYNYARGFDRVYAYAGAGGDDRASLYDSAGNDLFYGLPEYALMRGENSEFYNYARGFDRVYAYAGAGGDDRASLYDSAGNDLFYGLPEYALMRGKNSEFYNYARGFDRVYAYASSGGDDRASLYDSAGNDLFYGLPEYALIRGENSEFYNYVRGFDRVYACAGAGGIDQAFLYDSLGDDMFRVGVSSQVLEGDGFYISAAGYRQTNAYVSEGFDQVLIDRVHQDESLYGQGNLVQISRPDSIQNAYSFDKVIAAVEDGALVDIDSETINYIYEEFGASLPD